MKTDINNAETKNAKKVLADIVIECITCARKEKRFTKSYENMILQFELPYFEMFSRGITVYDVI